MSIKGIPAFYELILILIIPCFCLAGDITLDNWIYHSDIKEVRKIYSDIKNGVKSGKYKIREYHGDKNCQEMGCTTYQFEISTNNGFILACGFTSFINIYSNEEIREEYFDGNGILRFRLYQARYFDAKGKVGREEIGRLYQDENGRQIWSIGMLDGKVTDYRSSESNTSFYLETNKECKKYSWGQ